MDKMVSMVLDLYRKSVDQVCVSDKELFEAEKTLSVAITSEKVISSSSDRVSQLLELIKHVDHLKYHVYG